MTGLIAFQLRDHLVVLGENSGVVFRVDLFAIGDDIKYASTAFDQLALDTCCCSHCVRQTDGFGRVVSLDAVRDRNVHSVLLQSGETEPARRLSHCRDEVNAESLVRIREAS